MRRPSRVFERAHILAVVRAAGGHMSRAMPTARWMLAALALALLVCWAPPAAAPPPVATEPPEQPDPG